MTSDRQLAVIMAAIRDHVADSLREQRAEANGDGQGVHTISVPEIRLTPTINSVVDLAPVAEAIERALVSIADKLPTVNVHPPGVINQVAAPQVDVHVPVASPVQVAAPEVKVRVDTSPIAEAMEHMAEMVAQLVQALADQPKPVRKPIAFRLEQWADGTKRIVQE